MTGRLGKQLADAHDGAADNLIVAFDDNRLLTTVFGEHDEHLALIEQRLGVTITPRGNRVALSGNAAMRERARQILQHLYLRASRGHDINAGDVTGAIRMTESAVSDEGNAAAVRTRKKTVVPRSPRQRAYLEAIGRHDLVFGTGPAGTGKTYLAVACAAAELEQGRIDRIILSRPAVEAGERLGFLPGDVKEKVDPYLRPLYDALYDVMPANLVARGLAEGTIEIAPLAFMRGRTLTSAFVILDEAQNATSPQMKMFLTRLGEGSRMVVTGDPTQIDLPRGVESGLDEALRLLTLVAGIAHVTFTAADIVRHDLVTRIVEAYESDHGSPRRKPES